MRVLILFLLSNPLFAAEFRSPAAFTTTSCIENLMGENARQKTDDAVAWLNKLKPITWSVYQWTSETDGREVINPRAIFFDEVAPGTTLEQVLDRYEAAKRDADRASQSPTATVIETRDTSEMPPLPVDQILALGFRSDEYVSAKGLIANVQVEAGALLVKVEDGEGNKGQFRLALKTLMQGFDNAVGTWQALNLDPQTTPPIRTYSDDARFEHQRKFIGAHGKFILTRRTQGRTFAYVFDRRMIKRDPKASSALDLTIFEVTECDRATVMQNSLIITAPRSNQNYLCFKPMGLRFVVPHAPMDAVFPSNFAMRQVF